MANSDTFAWIIGILAICLALIGFMLPEQIAITTFPYDNLTGVPNIDLIHGLNLWLPFDSVVLDKSGYRNDGVVYGTSYVTGRFSSALNFNGVSDYVVVPHSGSVDVYSGGFSFSFWVNFTDLVSGVVICKPAYSGTFEVSYRVDLQAFWFCGVDTGGYKQFQSNVFVFTTGMWYHVVCVYDNSFGCFFINNVLSGNTTISIGNRMQNTDFVYIGMRGDSSVFFNGLIDELRIYNRVLNQAEISALYNLP